MKEKYWQRMIQRCTAEVKRREEGGGRTGTSFEKRPASRRSVSKVRSSLGELGLNSNHNNKVNGVIPVR